MFQRNVTLGEWDEVKSFLAGLSEKEGKAAYEQLLKSLNQVVSSRGARPANPGSADPATIAMMNQSRSAGARFRETNVFSFVDVLGLINAAPVTIEKTHISPLGSILRKAIADGHDLDPFVARLHADLDKPEDEQLVSRRQCALLLFAAGEQIRAGDFLPSPEKAQADDDREALNLISRQALALYAKEKKTEHLETAWRATQGALAVGSIDKETKEEALKRAVELAPKIREEMGQAWLDESFGQRKERGKELLATIGSATSTNMQTQVMNAENRLKALQLQKTAVDALLKAAPETATQWQTQLNVLAENWLREAKFSYQQGTTSSRGPQLRRDPFGNIYYADENQAYYRTSRSNRGQPIATSDVLETRPGQEWMDLVGESIRPKFNMVFAQLFLKVNEEDKAFPYIEQFAKTQPDKALELAHEFLRVWTRNHNPNESRNRTNYYMFMYGFERRANQIPLTRSKQERNLKELADWVQRLRELPMGDLDEELLVGAFTTSHSTAEVYRLESIEKVFGSVDSLKPETLAEMIQKMRGNLAGIWRQPAEQKKQNTNRKQKDLQVEVQRGYRVAREVLDRGLEKYPEHWQLQLANACLMHDQNDYDQEIAKSSQYSERREQAMLQFARASELYAAKAGDLAEDKESTRVFELWYYASLGAVDLGRITNSNQPDLRQPALIRKAIQSLPNESVERHMGQFANSLFTRLSAVKPELKYRYLRTGFEITGDHARAYEARKVFDYYNDLVTEIKLETRVDGSDMVGSDKPFGVFVNILHTKEIERESGGFAKYLQNQNNQYYAFNYGRPTENYRDKFQEAATAALQEQFDVLSVTFNHPEAHSIALPEYGWRKTPYAYLLLKARGPEVDKIPPVKLDLDFLDTSGYAIIPVESATLPIDAKSSQPEARPNQKLQIVQTLDERQAGEGKLILEIKGTALGLVPELEELVDVKPKDFDVVEIDDQGLSISQFDREADDPTVVSERLWMVTLAAREDLTTPPKTFTFPAAVLTEAEMTHQRFVDADLVTAEATVDLERRYSNPDYTWVWALPLVICGLIVVAVVLIRSNRSQDTIESHGPFRVPDEVTPFTVLSLLKKIEHNNGLNDAKRDELVASINRLERHFFISPEDNEPNLEQIANDWVRQTRA